MAVYSGLWLRLYIEAAQAGSSNNMTTTATRREFQFASPFKRDGKAPRCWLFSLKHRGKEEDFFVETLPVVIPCEVYFFPSEKGVWRQSNWLQTLQDCFQQNCWAGTQPKLLKSSYWPWKIVWKGLLLEWNIIYICVYGYDSMIHINILCDNPKMILNLAVLI